MIDNIAVITIHYQTPDLLSTTIESFKKFYPDVRFVIIDNGSKDTSRTIINTLVNRFGPATEAVYLSNNIFHGPAMDLALREEKERYIFFLDSDTKTLRGGFLEAMVNLMETSDRSYAVGRIDLLTKRGFISPKGTIRCARTPYMLIKREPYALLPPFKHHGMPTIKNFSQANERGLLFHDFPIQDYIEHRGKGTAERFGYQLGIKSKLDFILNKLGF